MSSTPIDPSENSPPHDPLPQSHQEQHQEVEQRQPLLQPLPPAPPIAFDYYLPKYKCCCGCMHVKVAVIIIGILSCFGLAFSIWSAISWINQQPILGYSELAAWCLFFPVLISLFIGIITKNQYFLLPYIIYGIISAIATIIFTIFLIVVLSIGTAEVKEEVERQSSGAIKNEEFGAALGILITVSVMEMIFQVSFIAWFTWVVFKCYRYFRDLKNYSGNAFIGHEP